MVEKFRFRHSIQFRAKHPTAYDTLQKLAGILGSKWTVGLFDAARPAVGDPAAVGAANVVQVTGEDDVRRFLCTHRRVYNVTGSRAWTLSERIV